MLPVAMAQASSDGVVIGYVLLVLWMNVMFSCHGANGPESSTTLCLEEVCQLAVPVGCQTAAVFG